MRTIIIAVLLGWMNSVIVAGPTPGAASAAPPATRPYIPREILEVMYRQELGPLYDPALADNIYLTHKLVERYFSPEYSDAESRKALTRWINEIGLDANIVGRIARLRMDWPQVPAGCHYIFDKIGAHEVHYFLGVPRDYDRTRSWPLYLKLPNAAALVATPAWTADDAVKIYSAWINEELAVHPDAIVVMPLFNFTEAYGPGYLGMNTVIQSMHDAANWVNIDPARVYLGGHSMAAYAVWNLGLHYTTYFAALAPMAGWAKNDWQRTRMLNLGNLLEVVWHDAQDQVVKVDSSRELVNILHRFKCDVDYEETSGVGHVPTPAIVEKVYQKMRARTRELYPRRVGLQSNRPDTLFNRLDWVQVYEEMSPGEEQKWIFRLGTGTMKTWPNSYTIEAARSGPNSFDVKTVNVDSMRFYFNDQMADFSKPVTIRVNGVVRFNALIKPSVEEMLKDQVFLGRGWRYFTGIVDIDFDDLPGSTRPGTRPSTLPLHRPITLPAPP